MSWKTITAVTNLPPAMYRLLQDIFLIQNELCRLSRHHPCMSWQVNHTGRMSLNENKTQHIGRIVTRCQKAYMYRCMFHILVVTVKWNTLDGWDWRVAQTQIQALHSPAIFSAICQDHVPQIIETAASNPSSVNIINVTSRIITDL